MRDDLPGGTVTFLFTDVEGSTRLLHELGAEGYAEALFEHRRAVREACASEGGVEVDTQGDAFFFAFPTAPGAAAAAASLTVALRPGPIHVRVGLHTGTPLLTDEGYVGPDVHRAARIAAAGHGGQVLVSAATAPLVDVELRDLGEHRFKDLASAERVCQLGEDDFPSLRSLFRTNLPVPATPFLGRDRELGEVVELLARDDVRLLTLTGPGGTGKTRLSLQAAAESAEEFPDGLWWVGLASHRDAHLVLPAVAEVLGIEEEAGRALPDVLTERLTGRRMLVVLDNAEHLLPAIAEDVALLRDIAGGPTVLVTSRERLQIQGEETRPVPSLDGSDAVALFVSRARAAGNELVVDDAVRELCDRLDNLPLALELAAARTVVFSTSQLLERLSDRLDLLRAGRDSDPRQQTLRATIEWSYELLDAPEKELFRSLAVFVGGSTYEAAEEICEATPDTLQSLIDKSLLRRRETPLGPRYWMLETIREFAAGKLEESGTADAVRLRHAESFLELGRSLGLTMETLERVGRQRHDVAIAEQDNFRAAIDWAVDGHLDLAVEIAFSIENFWVTHDPNEGIRRFDVFLERAGEVSVANRAAAYRTRGNVTIFAGDRVGGVENYAAATALYRELGDEVGVLLMEQRAFFNREGGDPGEQLRELEAFLERYRTLGLRTGEVQILGALALVARRAGETERALALLRTAADLAESIGFAWMEGSLREELAGALLDAGRPDEAHDAALRALSLAGSTGDRIATVSSLTQFVRLAAQREDRERAGVLWGALRAEEGREPLGLWRERRERVEAQLELADDPEFVRGFERGRLLSLDKAVEYAVAG